MAKENQNLFCNGNSLTSDKTTKKDDGNYAGRNHLLRVNKLRARVAVALSLIASLCKMD